MPWPARRLKREMQKPTSQQAAQLFQKGIDQFNRGEFFESHESWEVVWLPAPEPDKTFLQGIIQVAAALHHYHRGNRAGARSLLRRGLRKIETFPDDYRSLRLEEIRVACRQWHMFLDGKSQQKPEVPTIRRTTGKV